MGLGWPQPQTAAITVLLIAAAGAVSESLQKGVLRVAGTVAGAVIGLSLVALFPQERMLYLLSVSLVISALLYLYNAYQRDSTAIMLTAVVTLMVFNGGDAEGAFIYGVDRALMTAFGVLIYTLVSALLWPVKPASNTREQAGAIMAGWQQGFAHLHTPAEGPVTTAWPGLAQQLAAADEFQSHLANVRGADEIAAYAAEWRAISGCFQRLQRELVPSLLEEGRAVLNPDEWIEDHSLLVAHIDRLFNQAQSMLDGQEGAEAQPLPVAYRSDKLRSADHLTIARAVARGELLEQVQETLCDLIRALNSLVHQRGRIVSDDSAPRQSSFVWLDQENLLTALRGFLTFWLACAIWIWFNPPGGFLYITMCAVLIVLVSYTPVSPKVLIVLLTLGFAFALPAYIFLLPQLTHWAQLALFLFCYGFVGFFFFAGPISIFFLLGVFTLGIQNTMSYNVDLILSIMLMFYLVCATLIITTYLPFSSRPESLYRSLVRRFFLDCAQRLDNLGRTNPWRALIGQLIRGRGDLLLTKMQLWGSKIDFSFFRDLQPESIQQLYRQCDILCAQLDVIERRQQAYHDNRLIRTARESTPGGTLANACRALADNDLAALDALTSELADIEQRLDNFMARQRNEDYDRDEVAGFYSYLALQASLLHTLQNCRDARQAMATGLNNKRF